MKLRSNTKDTFELPRQPSSRCRTRGFKSISILLRSALFPERIGRGTPSCREIHGVYLVLSPFPPPQTYQDYRPLQQLAVGNDQDMSQRAANSLIAGKTRKTSPSVYLPNITPRVRTSDARCSKKHTRSSELDEHGQRSRAGLKKRSRCDGCWK